MLYFFANTAACYCSSLGTRLPVIVKELLDVVKELPVLAEIILLPNSRTCTYFGCSVGKNSEYVLDVLICRIQYDYIAMKYVY